MLESKLRIAHSIISSPSAFVRRGREIAWPAKSERDVVNKILTRARVGYSEEKFSWRSYFMTAGQQEIVLAKLVDTMNELRGYVKQCKLAQSGSTETSSTLIDFALYKAAQITEPDSKRLSRTYDRCHDLLQAESFVFFTVDRDVDAGSWLECGQYLNRITTLASEAGLVSQTCGFYPFHASLQSILRWSDSETPVCGMALYGFQSMCERTD